MSIKIKDAFSKVKKDIDVVNRKIDSSEKKKMEIQNEMLVIRRKITVEEELRTELGSLINNIQTGLSEITPLKKDMDAKFLIVKDEFKNEMGSMNKRLDEMEKQISEGIMGLSETLTSSLKQIHKAKAKEEVIEHETFEKAVKKEKKVANKDKKKGFISRLIDTLADEE